MDCIEVSNSFCFGSITDTIAASSSPLCRIQNEQGSVRPACTRVFLKGASFLSCMQRRPSCAAPPAGPSLIGTFGAENIFLPKNISHACQAASRKHACEAICLPPSNMGNHFAEDPATAEPSLYDSQSRHELTNMFHSWDGCTGPT